MQSAFCGVMGRMSDTRTRLLIAKVRLGLEWSSIT